MKGRVVVLSGAGQNSRLSFELIRRIIQEHQVVAISRRAQNWKELNLSQEEQGRFQPIVLDLLNSDVVLRTVENIEDERGPITGLIHLAGKIVLRPFLETSPSDFEDLIKSNYLSSIAISQAVIAQMLKRSSGTIIFSGATGSVRGGGRSAAFASSKFALRGLAQSLAREFGPKGIHVAHLILDGKITGQRAQEVFNVPEEDCLDPKALAELYHSLLHASKNAWVHEMDVRPYNEKF